MPSPVYPVYQVEVDWSDDGFLEPSADDLTTRIIDGQPFTWERGMDQLVPLSTIIAGRSNAELDNRSRDYSAKNPASPLLGKLTAGHALFLKAYANGADGVGVIGTFHAVDAAVSVDAAAPVDGFSGPVSSRYRGVLDGLPQHPDIGRRSVELPSLGTLSLLKVMSDVELGDPVQQTGVSTALYQTLTTDAALGHLLDAIGFPASMRVFDTGITVLNWWWVDNEDPLTAAQTILNSEGPGARLYEDGDGNIVFESSHYRQLQSRCTTVQATFSDGSGPEPRYAADAFLFDSGEKDVVNLCTVQQKIRSLKALTAVWSYGQTLTLAANAVQKLTVTNSDPFTAAVVPVGGTDYTVTSGAVASLTLDRTSGANCTMTITAGAAGVTLTGLQLRAQPVTVDSTQLISNSRDTSASQKTYGVKRYPLTVRAEIDANVLLAFCDAVVFQQQFGRAKASITLDANANVTRMAQALGRLISDRVALVESWTGLNLAMFLEKISESLQIAAGHTSQKTTFGLEECGTSYAVWGTDVWGTGLWGY